MTHSYTVKGQQPPLQMNHFRKIKQKAARLLAGLFFLDRSFFP